jgi:hypothetical protein
MGKITTKGTIRRIIEKWEAEEAAAAAEADDDSAEAAEDMLPEGVEF